MQRAGAHLLDVGGESTRPGALRTRRRGRRSRASCRCSRRSPRASSVPLSIDTRKAAVARAALAAGACVVNDVSGGSFDPDLCAAVAEHDAYFVIGHLRGTPATMQDAPHFDDVLAEVDR